MALCGSASLWAKLAFVAVCVALILDIVGFATVSWMVYQVTTSSVRVGLWRQKVCTGSSCVEDGVTDTFKNDEFYAALAFEITAFVAFLILPFMVGVYVFAEAVRGRCLCILCMCLCFLATLLGIIGMICWLVYVSDPYVASWSMGMTVLAAILTAIAGLLLVPDYLDDDYGDGRAYQRRPSYPDANRQRMYTGHDRVASPGNSRFVMGRVIRPLPAF